MKYSSNKANYITCKQEKNATNDNEEDISNYKSVVSNKGMIKNVMSRANKLNLKKIYNVLDKDKTKEIFIMAQERECKNLCYFLTHYITTFK